MPDMAKELGYFARNPFNPKENLTIETLIDFTIFDEDTKIAKISENV